MNVFGFIPEGKCCLTSASKSDFILFFLIKAIQEMFLRNVCWKFKLWQDVERVGDKIAMEFYKHLATQEKNKARHEK